MSHRTLRITESDRVMVLAVHPDDESLATGGLLQRAVAAGAAVRVIFVTDGENNPWPQRVLERRWRITPADRARWGQRRRREALAALARLGVPAADARFLGWPDQGLTRLLLGRAAREASETLAQHVRDWRPSLLFAPSLQDRHPDHNALAVLCRLALAGPPDGDPGRGGPGVFHYLVHGPGANTAGPGVFLPLFVWEKWGKHAAITEHASQLLLSRERFLAYATDEERFAPSAPPVRHGLTGGSARTSGTALTVECRFESPLGAFERPRLHLVFPSGADAGGITAWTIPLGGTAGGLAPILRGHDAAVIGEASVRLHRRQHVSVCLPLRHSFPAGKIFLKLQRRRTFLDAGGWDELCPTDDLLPWVPARTVVPSLQAARRSW